MALIHPEQHIPEDPFSASHRLRTSESHSRRTSPSQVYGSYDSFLCRTPFQKTVINCFLFTNRFRCTIKEKTPPRVVFFCFIPYPRERTLIRRANGMFAYRLRYLRREDNPSGVTEKTERIAEIYPEQHIPEKIKHRGIMQSYVVFLYEILTVLINL